MIAIEISELLLSMNQQYNLSLENNNNTNYYIDSSTIATTNEHLSRNLVLRLFQLYNKDKNNDNLMYRYYISLLYMNIDNNNVINDNNYRVFDGILLTSPTLYRSSIEIFNRSPTSRNLLSILDEEEF